ncbi:hypothetical protein [Heyndrickxia sporothermodurans]
METIVSFNFILGGMLPEVHKSIIADENTWACIVARIPSDFPPNRNFQLYGKQANSRE